MGDNGDLIAYVKMLKQNELYAAEVRYAAARKARKKGMKGMPLGIRIAAWMNYWLLRDTYIIKSYTPTPGFKLL